MQRLTIKQFSALPLESRFGDGWILTANSNEFDFHRDRVDGHGVLVAKEEFPFFGGDYPEKIEVRSVRTGRVASFRQASISEQQDNDFWDGEFMEFYPEEDCGVEVIVLHA